MPTNYCKFEAIDASDRIGRPLCRCTTEGCGKQLPILKGKFPLAACRIQGPDYSPFPPSVDIQTVKSLPCLSRREKAGDIGCPTCDGGTTRIAVYVCTQYKACIVNPTGRSESLGGVAIHVCNGCPTRRTVPVES